MTELGDGAGAIAPTVKTLLSTMTGELTQTQKTVESLALHEVIQKRLDEKTYVNLKFWNSAYWFDPFKVRLRAELPSASEISAGTGLKVSQAEWKAYVDVCKSLDRTKKVFPAEWWLHEAEKYLSADFVGGVNLTPPPSSHSL